MPSGKITKVEREEEPNEELEEMLKIPRKSSKTDPMQIPADFRFMCEELGKKGGIRVDNCQEIEVIKHAVFNQYKDEDLRDSVFQLIDLMVNFSNLWLIHFNRHKDSY